MDAMNSDKVARREFLKIGITTAAIGAMGVRFSLRKVLAQAKRLNKPLLTERNLNSLIPQEADAFRQLAMEAKRNLKAFIKKHFYLVESQKRKLEALSNEEIDFVRNEIDKALMWGYRIRVEFRRRSTNVGVRFVSAQKDDPNAEKSTKWQCKGNLCANQTMTENDRGGVIGYGDDCDIAGG